MTSRFPIRFRYDMRLGSPECAGYFRSLDLRFVLCDSGNYFERYSLLFPPEAFDEA